MVEVDVFRRLEIGEEFSGAVTLNMKSKRSLHPRAYLYTSDETLMMVAENRGKNRNSFRVARKAIDFDTDRSEIIGKCGRGIVSGTWKITRAGEENPSVVAEYLRRMQKKSSRRIVNVTIKDGESELALTQEDFKAAYPQLVGAENEPVPNSKRNFVLTDSGRLVFAFAEMSEDDEFQLKVAAPLSIFEGFCLALTTFFLISNEV